MKKYFLIITSLFLIITSVLLFLFFGTRFYIKEKHERINNKPITIRCIYKSKYYGDYNLYEQVYTSKNKGYIISQGLELSIATDLRKSGADPESSVYAIDNNIFELTVFRYRFITFNRITHYKFESNNRVDVISWKVLPPYKMLNNNGKIVNGTTPVFFETSIDIYDPNNFIPNSYY